MSDRRLFSSIFAFASGILLYFSLYAEPVLRFPILISILSALCFIKYKRIIFLFIFGFFYSSVRTNIIDTKLLTRNLHNADIAGVVESVDYAAMNQRVYIRTTDDMLLRISIPKNVSCAPGADIKLRAQKLFAPGGIDAFNRFDYRRWSFFNGLSGTGYAEAALCVGGESGLRSIIHNAVQNKLADSLVLGYKNAIPKDENEKIKSAGIAHVFSISGFHLTLVGGWLFLLFYSIIKLFPRIVRRWPARNLALPLTALGLFGYMMLSGAAIATVRSFLMVLFGSMAVILGRKVLTLRNAAIVFGLMIFINPFFIVSAGFQLSFAAVFGLLYFFGRYKIAGGRVKKALYFFVMTDIVATISTAPFLLYHFGNFPLYTLLGNLILLPIFSIGIMPLVMIGTLTAILGWALPLDLAGRLYEFVIGFSGWISKLPFANLSLPEIPAFSIYLVFAGMFLILVQKGKFAYFAFAAAILFTTLKPVPILRATDDNEVVGFVGKFNTGYSEKHPFIIPRGKKSRADCKKGVCVYKAENWTAVSFQKFIPLYNNLAGICDYDFIISYLPLYLSDCPDKVIKGGAMIYSDGTVLWTRQSRPWSASIPDLQKN